MNELELYTYKITSDLVEAHKQIATLQEALKDLNQELDKKDVDTEIYSD